MRNIATLLLLTLTCPVSFAHDETCPQCGSKTGPGGKPVLLIVGNEKGETITFSPDQFAALEQTRVEIPEKDGGESTYEGVPVGKLLELAGIDFKGLCDKPASGPPLLAHYVLIDAADGYQTAFSLIEVAPDADGPPVLVARQKNGKPLESTGPFQIVDTKSTVHGRWVRQVARILVQRVGAVPVNRMKDAAVADGLKGHGGLYLVGLGPGAPGLVTLRARQILASADRVFCFHWLKEQVATLANPDKIVVASPYLMGGL